MTALPDMVGEPHLAQQRQRASSNRRLSSGASAKVSLAPGDRGDQLRLHRLAQAAALRHQLEQAAQRGVEIGAVAGLRRVQRLHLEIAQALQAVALEVDLALADRHVAEFGPRLDVEHEQQPVDHDAGIPG